MISTRMASKHDNLLMSNGSQWSGINVPIDIKAKKRNSSKTKSLKQSIRIRPQSGKPKNRHLHEDHLLPSASEKKETF